MKTHIKLHQIIWFDVFCSKGKEHIPPYVSNSFSGGGVDGILETKLTSGEPNLLLYKKLFLYSCFVGSPDNLWGQVCKRWSHINLSIVYGSGRDAPMMKSPASSLVSPLIQCFRDFCQKKLPDFNTSATLHPAYRHAEKVLHFVDFDALLCPKLRFYRLKA